MRILRKILAVVAGLLLALPAMAQGTGFYVGAGLGQASYREACHDLDEAVSAAGAFTCLNREDTGQKLFAGWRFAQYAAVEASYMDFGEAKAQGNTGAGIVDASAKVKAAGVSALGILPLGDRFSAYARLGLLQTRTETRSSGAATGSGKHSEVELHVGVGAQLELGRSWGLRAEFERVNDSKIDLTSLAVLYRF
jgi:OmpA-OmpF porin, OOP family